MARSERRRRAPAGTGGPSRARREAPSPPTQAEPIARLLALQAGLGNQAVQQRASSCPSLSACPTGGTCDPCPARAATSTSTASPAGSVSRPTDPDERAADQLAGTILGESTGLTPGLPTPSPSAPSSAGRG